MYFAAPYGSLRRILATGAILPRNAVAEVQTENELSASGVQARRKDVFLGNGERMMPPLQMHDCLNFFLNPCNTTIDAFCHNQLILNGFPLALGIIEIPLSAIANHLEAVGGLWACSDKNIAVGGYTSAIIESLRRRWPWDEIFGITEDRHTAAERSAEFLLWLKGGSNQASAGLPLTLASRLLQVPTNPFGDASPLVVGDFARFRADRDLLVAETHLARFLQRSPLSAFSALGSFEAAVASVRFELTTGIFANADLSRSNLHGIPHVTRVMFWTHYLTQDQVLRVLMPEALTDAHLAHDSMFAAMIHDLRRVTDEEDSQHGEEAANFFTESIAEFCGGDSKRVRRIEDAVTWHCRPDSDCPNAEEAVFRRV